MGKPTINDDLPQSRIDSHDVRASFVAEAFIGGLMKLMFCPDCWDVFKLVRYGERSCLCGKVKGKLTDNRHAIINGEGVSLMLDNVLLVESLEKLASMDQNESEEYYKGNARVLLHVRPNSGNGNPRTKIIRSEFESSETEVLSPDKVTYRYIKGM